MTQQEAGKLGGRGNKARSDTTAFQGKRDVEYLTARIARDRPDIIERMKAGDYPSIKVVIQPCITRLNERANCQEHTLS